MSQYNGIVEVDEQALDAVTGGDICCLGRLEDRDGDGEFDTLVIFVDTCVTC